ncbi:hypothetical protein CIB48_g5125 [Xylaria polymorpha]|nr:hypothetical protein CIB48_g5125 [Xylaria polymorpha]
MNAHALLTAQGWRGTGHSLHPTDDRTGLTHHILIKRNQDGSGLGSKKDHKQEAWWLNAFDQALKGIDMKSGTMKQTLKGGALEKITARNVATKYTGARGLYTSGAGTPLSQEPETKISKREETKEERRARREAKKLKKAAKEAQQEAQRRAAQKVEKKKAKKAERQAAKEKLKAGETKEERRARRDARRRRKEEKRLMRAAKG